MQLSVNAGTVWITLSGEAKGSLIGARLPADVLNEGSWRLISLAFAFVPGGTKSAAMGAGDKKRQCRLVLLFGACPQSQYKKETAERWGPYFSLQPMTLSSLSKPAFRMLYDRGITLKARAVTMMKAPWPISICYLIVSIAGQHSVYPSASPLYKEQQVRLVHADCHCEKSLLFESAFK